MNNRSMAYFHDSEFRLIDSNDNGGRRRILKGIALRIGSFTSSLGDYKIVFKPGSFDNYFRSNQETKCFLAHLSAFVLGSTTAGTYRVRFNREKQLIETELDIPDHCFGDYVYEAVKRGDIKNQSIAYRGANSKIVKHPEHGNVLEIYDITKMPEISILPYGAMSDSDIWVADSVPSRQPIIPPTQDRQRTFSDKRTTADLRKTLDKMDRNSAAAAVCRTTAEARRALRILER